MIRYFKKLWQMRQRSRGRRDLAAGFTMLEIMIVVAIGAALVAGVAVVVMKKLARKGVGDIVQGISQYMIDNNNCPKSLEELVAQKYIARPAAKDPWGKDYKMACPGTHDTETPDVSSSGPDKADGTADDIQSWAQ
jgi:prepilin-type N-terminal cleavage/methylation domain-containing protein